MRISRPVVLVPLAPAVIIVRIIIIININNFEEEDVMNENNDNDDDEDPKNGRSASTSRPVYEGPFIAMTFPTTLKKRIGIRGLISNKFDIEIVPF